MAHDSTNNKEKASPTSTLGKDTCLGCGVSKKHLPGFFAGKVIDQVYCKACNNQIRKKKRAVRNDIKACMTFLLEKLGVLRKELDKIERGLNEHLEMLNETKKQNCSKCGKLRILKKNGFCRYCKQE